MPIYQFRCCGKDIEVIQGLNEDGPLCPNCGAEMKRLPTFPAIIEIKGTGGVPARSKGYKQGYSAEYLESIGRR